MNPDNTIVSDDTVHTLQDLRVDNEGFFDAVESRLADALTVDEIHKRARLELKSLIADMKKQQYIRGVTEWTASEQQNFLQKVKQEIADTGILFSARLRDTIRKAIEHEVWREINDDGMKYSLKDGEGNTILLSSDYQHFLKTSFLVERNTTIVPMDLELMVQEDDPIDEAIKKIERYQKYNALILVDSEKRPIGMIKLSDLLAHKAQGNSTLQGIKHVPNLTGQYNTSKEKAEEIMGEYGINILPIVDSLTGILIWILTQDSLKRKDMRYYSTVSLTELSLSYLKSTTQKQPN